MLASNFLHRPDLDNFILVLTMGKVGSTSLVRSLEAVNIFCRHLQWLSPETQAFHDRLGEMACWENESKFDRVLIRLNVMRAHDALRDPDYASLLKVISVIRAPIELILSHCFHGIEVFAWDSKQRGRDFNLANLSESLVQYSCDYMEHRDRTLAELREGLRDDNYCSTYFHWVVHNYLHWFDREFNPFFAVEIVSGQMKDGYQVAGNTLILKFEELQSNGERAVALYSQRRHFKLLRENVSAEKSYGDLYQQAAREIRFPREFVDHLCDSKYVRHFYSREERQRMRDRWTS